MTDAGVQRVLDEHLPIASILVQRGGWLRSARIEVRSFHDMWAIDLMADDSADTPWHTFYCSADQIIGISVRRHDGRHQEPRGEVA